MNFQMTPHVIGVFLLISIIAAASALPMADPNLPDPLEPQISHQISQGSDHRYVSHQILVRFSTPENTNGKQPTATAGQIAAIHTSIGATVIKSYSPAFLPGLELVRIPDSMTVPDAVAWYTTQSSVRYAEPDAIISQDDLPVQPGSASFPEGRSSSVPDDPFYQYQWSLNNTGQDGGTPGVDIRAPGAWNITTGSQDVVIAVIDSGVDYKHPDLIDNIWSDPVTGQHGYDFVNNDSDPMDDCYHGTACAGLIAATGNNSIAMTGVSWKARIMAVKVLDSSGDGEISDAISGIEYASLHGADIISNSWGFREKSDALVDAVNRFPGLAVWSAGNDNLNTDDMPIDAHFSCLNTVAVMSSDNHDKKADFSNFGRKSVQLAAPGVNMLLIVPLNYTRADKQILSSGTGSGVRGSGRPLQIITSHHPGSPDIPYIFDSGTSFSAPLVSGTAALIKASNPGYSTAQIKSTLLQSVDIIPSLSGVCITGGRLNASAALSRPLPAYDAIGTITMLSKVTPGSACPITVPVQNTGTQTWASNRSLCLRAENRDASRFNTSIYPLPKERAVNPGETVVFMFNGTAPTDGGYQPEYRMYQNNTGFGQIIRGHTSVTSAEILPGPPELLTGSAMVSDNGSVFLMGGYNDTYESSKSAYRYDIRAMKWSNLTPMPHALDGISGSVIKGKIYIPGGYSGDSHYDPTTYVYEISTDRWSSLATEQTPPGRARYKAAVLGDRLYVLGGFISWNQTTDLVYYLNTTTAIWHQAPSMHIPRAGFAASSGNNTILVAGGYNFSLFGSTFYSSAERFDGVNWSWIDDIPDNTGWGFMASGSEEDGSLWMAGGKRYSSAGIVSDNVATYNLSLNQWSVTPDQSTIWYPRPDMATGTMDDDGYLYTAQGSDWESRINSFERLHVYLPEMRPVTNLHTTKILPHLITWNWTIPDSGRIDHLQVALNGVMKTTLPPEITSYTAVELMPDTKNQISLRTSDAFGNTSQWVNNTAQTAHWYRDGGGSNVRGQIPGIGENQGVPQIRPLKDGA